MRCVLIAALVGCVVALGSAPASTQKKAGKTDKKEEPKSRGMIGGKTFEQWKREIKSSDPSKQMLALQNIQFFEPERAREAIPDILYVLSKNSDAYPLDISVRVNATIALGNILSNIKDPYPKQVNEAVLRMKRMLRYDEEDIVRYRAVQALAQISSLISDKLKDETAKLLLYPLREGKNWETRQAAAVTIGRLAMPALPTKGEPLKLTIPQKQALAQAIDALSKRVYDESKRYLKHDPSSQVRLASLRSLMTLGQLVPLLPDPENPRAKATQQAKEIHDRMEKALKQAALHDPDQAVQVWANVTLMVVNLAEKRGTIDPKNLAHIGNLLLEADDPLVRAQAAQALGMMGEKALSQIKQLVKALDDREKGVAAASLSALSQMGPKAIPAVGDVLADKNKDAALRVQAAGLLASLSDGSARQLTALGKLENNKARKDQQAALISLQAALRTRLPGLEEAAKDKDKNVKAAAIRALPHVDPAGVQYVGKLVAESKNDVPLRLLAMEALAAAGTKAEGQLSVLEEAAKDKDKKVKATAIRCLPHLGSAGVQYVGKFLSDSKDKADRVLALVSLAGAGPQAKSQVPLLIATLDDMDKDVVVAAVLALGHIGSDAKPAISRLQKLANSESTSEEIRALALHVIDVIEGIAKLKEEEQKSKTPDAGK
jgi:HEAT repeat protein